MPTSTIKIISLGLSLFSEGITALGQIGAVSPKVASATSDIAAIILRALIPSTTPPTVSTSPTETTVNVQHSSVE
jgi:hypothetical protein